MNISELRECITHFSEEIKQKSKHQDEVVVGGKITNIIPPFLDEIPMYLLQIDDYVGTLYVYLSSNLFEMYQRDLKVDHFICFKGFVNIVSQKIKDEVKKSCSIMAFDVLTLKKETIR